MTKKVHICNLCGVYSNDDTTGVMLYKMDLDPDPDNNFNEIYSLSPADECNGDIDIHICNKCLDALKRMVENKLW